MKGVARFRSRGTQKADWHPTKRSLHELLQIVLKTGEIKLLYKWKEKAYSKDEYNRAILFDKIYWLNEKEICDNYGKVINISSFELKQLPSLPDRTEKYTLE